MRFVMYMDTVKQIDFVRPFSSLSKHFSSLSAHFYEKF